MRSLLFNASICYFSSSVGSVLAAPTQGLSTMALATLCPGPDSAHVPTQKSFLKGGERKYFLFRAASDGCVQCVRKLLDEGVSPHAESQSCKYTAIDFASWEVAQASKNGRSAPGCEQVVAFLQQYTAAPSGIPSPQTPTIAACQPLCANTAEFNTAEVCGLCKLEKVSSASFSTLRGLSSASLDVNSRLRHAVWHECAACAQQLLVLRADPLAEEAGVWSESAMSLATAQQARAMTMLRMLTIATPPFD